MAKLEKKGTTILARWRKDTETPDDDLVSSRTRKYAARSDGTILVCDTATFRSETGRHTWGWKVYKRGCGTGSAAEARAHAFGKLLEGNGFQRESVT